MSDLDKSFQNLQQLVRAIWPQLQEIDWSLYCTQNYKAEPGEAPWNTGLVMDYAVDGVRADYVCLGAVPDISGAFKALDNKHQSIKSNPSVDSSLETRNPEKNIWAGGQRMSPGSRVTFAVTEMVDLGDHLLLRPLMFEVGMLTHQHLLADRDSETSLVKTARVYLGMSCMQYDALRDRMLSIVRSV